MDEITKEVITSMLKRLGENEKRIASAERTIKTLITNPIYSEQKVDPIIIPGIPASEDQKKYIKRLGGELENPELLTKQKAGEMIDGLLAKKKVTDSHSESPAVTEPEEVDTEDVGIDEAGLL